MHESIRWIPSSRLLTAAQRASNRARESYFHLGAERFTEAGEPAFHEWMAAMDRCHALHDLAAAEYDRTMADLDLRP